MKYIIKRQKKFEWGVRVQCFPAQEAGKLEWMTLSDVNDNKAKDELKQALPATVEAFPLVVEGTTKDGKAFSALHLRVV